MRYRYQIREIANKSAGALRRIEAVLVLESGEEESVENLVKIATSAMARLRRRRVAAEHIGKRSRWQRRPSYVWVKLYREDAVLRRLKQPARGDRNLLLEGEWVSSRYQEKPIYVKSPSHVYGRYRFALKL